LELANVAVHSVDLTNIKDVTLDAMTGVLTGAQYGATAQSFYGQACSVVGCSTYVLADMRAPDSITSVGTVSILSDDKLKFAVPTPINDGGAAVTGYKVYDSWPKATTSVTITGGELKSGASGEYTASNVQYPLNVVQNCFDSTSSLPCESKSASQEWIRVEFAETFVHSINIQTGSDATVGTFNLRYKGAHDQAWHVCPGSPYTHPQVTEAKTYDCESTQKSVAIELQQQNNQVLKLDLIEVYPIDVPATHKILDANNEIEEAGVGAVVKSYFILPVNDYGDSGSVVKVSVGAPSEPTQFVAAVTGSDTLAFEVEPPTGNGGKPITKFVATLIPLYGGLKYEEIKSGNCGALNGDYIKDIDTCKTATESVYGSGFWFGEKTCKALYYSSCPKGCWFDNAPGFEFTYINPGQS
jgi:hypothetical protein